MRDHPHWQRSSYSTGANNCVETGRRADGRLAVRDSKDIGRGVLLFRSGAWTSFLAAVGAPRGPEPAGSAGGRTTPGAAARS
ncbi:DUF397 domain-containing protein [Streptomyces boncukensis]|uniref:DUF397 domain-containing protein n=1 Tax=Streptomyces boncukensis TaxID=2711219 RepID=A0A6G4WXN5_9ACTN|nr:DUF397 domain-containing protein [Streptomyces boncukensis]NGO69868.1 DUF397 domain-containing protein [Streptomyces boncukensis]